VDPFSRKEWYDVKAPSIFAVRNAAKTCVNRTQGTSTPPAHPRRSQRRVRSSGRPRPAAPPPAPAARRPPVVPGRIR